MHPEPIVGEQPPKVLSGRAHKVLSVVHVGDKAIISELQAALMD